MWARYLPTRPMHGMSVYYMYLNSTEWGATIQAGFQANRTENKTDGFVGKLSGRTGSNGEVLHDVVYRLNHFFLTVCQQTHQFCFLFCLLGKLHCTVAPHSVLLQLSSDSHPLSWWLHTQPCVMWFTVWASSSWQLANKPISFVFSSVCLESCICSVSTWLYRI